MPEEKQEQFQELRCGSTGRGSVYDSVAGGAALGQLQAAQPLLQLQQKPAIKQSLTAADCHLTL